jgi:hypothetical protein
LFSNSDAAKKKKSLEVYEEYERKICDLICVL